MQFYKDPIVNAHHIKWWEECQKTHKKDRATYDEWQGLSSDELGINMLKDTLWCTLWENALIKARDGPSDWARGLIQIKSSLTRKGVDYSYMIKQFDKEYKEWKKNLNVKS